MPREVEEGWHLLGRAIGVTRIGKATIRVTELIEERMAHCLNSRKALCGCVLEQSRDQIDRFGGCFAKDLG